MEGIATPLPFDSALSRAGAGDEEAFADLVREHQRMVFGLACNTLGNRAVAEEVAQEVFLRLYRNLSRIESRDHLVHWLMRVTVNCCIDANRRSRFAAVPLEAVSEPVAKTKQEDPLRRRAIVQAVQQLPEAQRMAVVLKYQEGLELTEIAAVLKAPLNTVKSHLRRGLETLRRSLTAAGVAR